MNDREHEPIELDAYLDGLGDAAARAEFEARIAQDLVLREQVRLQAEVDASLARAFPEQAAPAQLLANLRTGELRSSEPARGFPKVLHTRRWKLAAGIAAAAAALLLAATWWSGRAPAPAPFFEQRSIASVYRDVVATGFEPYYECRENERFAETFRRRQGQALWLKRPPEGVRMLGLDYPGGTSRDSTAMLCDVHGEQVMVLVDRPEFDNPVLAGDVSEGLHLFEQERFGLHFYEIGPLPESHLIELFSDEFADGVNPQ